MDISIQFNYTILLNSHGMLAENNRFLIKPAVFWQIYLQTNSMRAAH